MKRLISTLLEPTENAPEATFLLVKLLDAKISRSTLEKEIKEHPDFPAFLSISDVLNNYGIENITARFEKKQYPELPTPFITQVKGERNVFQFTVVKDIDNNHVQFYDPEKQKWTKKDLASFSERSSAIVLLAETEEPVQEKNYSQKIKEEKRIKFSNYLMALCIPLIFLISGGYALYEFGVSAILPLTFSFVTLIGALITILLLWYEVDQSNAALQQICTSGKKTNCGAILQSKDAKIFGISWSTIGFVYFSGSLITLLFNGINSLNCLNVLSWLNVAAVPYVLYSVFYQWRVAKQWCVLCLSVQAVLLSQLFIAYAAGWHNFSFLETSGFFTILLQFLTAFSIPFITVAVLLPVAKKVVASSRVSMELQRLKHSPEIFNAVLEKQKSIVHSPDGLGIVLGNPNAKIKIIKVCNPYCGPCAKAHTPMEELLENNNDLQLQIIFTATNKAEDQRSYPVKHLLAINEKQNDELVEKALSDWYLADVKSYEAFAVKYPMNGELKIQDDKVEAMNDWCQKTEIQFTPTFFVNGYQLPPNYTVNDIKYFLSV